MVCFVLVVFSSTHFVACSNLTYNPESVAVGSEKKSLAELRRGFRLQALNAARLMIAKQSNQNEALLCCSHPDDLFLIHAVQAKETENGE